MCEEASRKLFPGLLLLGRNLSPFYGARDFRGIADETEKWGKMIWAARVPILPSSSVTYHFSTLSDDGACG